MPKSFYPKLNAPIHKNQFLIIEGHNSEALKEKSLGYRVIVSVAKEKKEARRNKYLIQIL
jgi:hypothetical protein